MVVKPTEKESACQTSPSKQSLERNVFFSQIVSEPRPIKHFSPAEIQTEEIE